MSTAFIHNVSIEEKQVQRKSRTLKFLLAFFFFIINADTISYLFFQNDAVVVAYQKTLFAIILALSLVSFFKWRKADRTCFLIFMALLVKVVADSLISYHSLLVYPSVLAVMFPFLYVYFIKNLFSRLNIDILRLLIVFIFLGYFTFMLLHGQDFDFSNTPLQYDETGPYAGDTRILHANSILLIVLPFLYFLNKLFSARKNYAAIAGLVVSLLIILIHQHRTVWLTTIFSSLVLLFIKGNSKNLLKKLFVFTLLVAGTLTLLVLTIPSLSQLFVERFMDVLDPLNEDNTGGFRYLQILAYLSYFIQKPLFGWTFSGFDLSNPFSSNAWEAGTGHHFHDAYIEVLFYFGITGLLLKFYPLYSVVRKLKRQLSDQSKVLAAFSVAGFLYSFSYVPPLIFWGIVGLCLYYIDRDLKHQLQSAR